MTETLRASAPPVATGAEAIAVLRDLASYVDARAEAFSARSSWLIAAATHLAGEPVVVVAHEDGQVVGLAALSVTRHRGTARVTLLGGDLNDYGQLHHDGPCAARALAGALVDWLRTQRRWSLDLTQLAPEDPALAALVRLLPDAVVSPGAPMPRIEGVGTSYRVKRDRRRKATGAFNAAGRDGLRAEKIVLDDLAGLERWLPDLVEVRRTRDHASGRRSQLDDPGVLAFHTCVVRGAVAAGAGVVHVMLVEGEVAGFVTVLVDGDAHRLLDGRVADRWLAYRGGTVCDIEAVLRAQDDPQVHTFDWLRGWTEAKFGNAEVVRAGLHASSHPSVDRLDRWEAGARRRLKAALPEAAVRRIVSR